MSKGSAAARGGANSEEWDPEQWEHASAATRLLARRRQMFDIQEELERHKGEYRNKEAEFKKREEELEAKDLELQESLVKYSKFLQEKDSNRIRADKKANDERRVTEQKDIEIKELREKLSLLRARYSQLSIDLGKNVRYQKYMDLVVEGSGGEYSEHEDVRGRWLLLDELKKEVNSHAKFFLSSNEEYKQRLLALTEAKEGEILECQNEIQMMKKEYEGLKLESGRLQETARKEATRKQDRALKLGQVKMACDSIYERLSMKSKVVLRKAVKPDDTILVLAKCGDVLADLMQIVDDYKATEPGHQESPDGAGSDNAAGAGAR
eukprot:COSAG03_NODE_520_length_7215_cov_38.328274_4_plen_323_part_00